MKKITSLLLSSSMLFTLCSPSNIAALELTDKENLFTNETSDSDASQDEKELINASSTWSEGMTVKFYINSDLPAYFKDFDTAWQAVVVNKKFTLDNDTEDVVGAQDSWYQLPDEFEFVMSKAQTVTTTNLIVEDGVIVNIVVAPFTSGGAARPQDITQTFNSGITVKNGGSLNFVHDSGGIYPKNVTVTLGGPIKVESGGSLMMESVDPTTDSNSTVYQLKENTEGSLLEVEAGGNATLTDVKLTSKNNVPVISASGNVTLNKGDYISKTTEVSNSGNGPAIELKENAKLSVNADPKTYGTISVSSTGQNQPAIKVENNASLSLLENSDAQITTTNNNGKAVDLAAGSKVQQGKNEITVAAVEGESASNYVDNYGNIVLQSGSEDKKVAPNTIIQPNGTAITGNNKLPDVKDDGSVTIPEGGAIVTNPDGNKIEVDKDDKVPAIAIGVKNKDGKIETSMRVESGGPSLTIEAASFDSNVNFSDYTCSVQSDKTNVATATLSDKDNTKITVTPVGVGEATITATFTKKDANGASLLSGETLTATFKVTVYKNSSGGGGGGGSTQKLNKVYRAYNPNNGEHLYTLDEKEFKHVTSLGWHDEGVAFMAETEKNGQALYRVYNPNSGLHHYTLDENEKNTLVSLGWHDEDVAWYTSKDDKDAVVYRVYNPNDGNHHYTMNQQEKDVLVSLGWQFEGIAFKTAPIEK